jgi:phage replication-related protein YjqB (UPF0714/DUF867 family)
MTEQTVAVRRAQLPEQDDLARHDEHCSMDPQTLAALGVEVGQQVRVTRAGLDGTVRGVFTVSQRRDEDPAGVVRMGLLGRRRLGTDDVFGAVASSVVVRSDLSDGKAEQVSEFVERLTDDGVQAELIVVAPHGGRIEPHTDEQAERMAPHFSADRVSTWLCRGFGDASEAWHITSDDLNPVSFPLLGQVVGRGFANAVSFHGFTPPDVLVGGAAPEPFRAEIADAIRAATAGSGLVVRTATAGDPLGGDDVANVVNRLTRDGRNGVQIEQSRRAREEHGAAIVDAVAGVYLRLMADAGAASRP